MEKGFTTKINTHTDIKSILNEKVGACRVSTLHSDFKGKVDRNDYI